MHSRSCICSCNVLGVVVAVRVVGCGVVVGDVVVARVLLVVVVVGWCLLLVVVVPDCLVDFL